MPAVVAPDLLKPHIPNATPMRQVDDALARLSGARAKFSALTVKERTDLLRVCLYALNLEARDWVRAACRAKGHALGSAAEGEEWLAGPLPVIRGLRLLIESLEANRAPQPNEVRQGPDSRTIVDVFPQGRREKMLYGGLQGEIWLQPGKDSSQGAWGENSGKLCAVLGAGNQTSIAPLDVLSKMFVEGQVCILKLNPVNAYVGPYIIRAFWKLIEANFFTVVYGDAELGAKICEHPAVETIHITGSHHTHDAIVWGGDVGEHSRRKQDNDKANSRPITSELGCVTPIVVTPGQWSEQALVQQARQTATMIAHNAGFNCNSGQVLVVSRQWPQRETFLAQVKASLEKIGTRKAYYPGAEERFENMRAHYPSAQTIGNPSAGQFPWLMADDVPPNAEEAALNTEAFCSFSAVTYVDESDPSAFLRRATALCNEQLWGNLSCAILHPESTPMGAVRQAVADLEYGTIGVNVWPGVAFGLGVMPWGAYPGNTAEDVQSGVGFVHNTMMFDHVQKGVLWAPPLTRPDPVWLLDAPRGSKIGAAIVDYETTPRLWKIPGLALRTLLG